MTSLSQHEPHHGHRRLRAVHPAEVHPEVFRAALGAHPAGVVVVTGSDGEGPVGLTATSFVSISLSPPLVGFAVATTSSTWARLRHADSMVIHLLGHDQDAIAATFATQHIDRFGEQTTWAPLVTGEPLLTDVRTWLRCRTEEHVALGDHVLVVARVLDARVDEDSPDIPAAAPLLYHRRGYRTTGLLAPSTVD